jgi:hypothetical protein
MRRTLGQRLIPPARPIAATLGACVALACTGAPDSGPALSVLSDDVEQDGWVDTAHAVAGDGATSFESDRNELSAGPGLPQPWQPFFYE